ncbi:MAG: GC-type dockerin domain-anchored protein [Planctomycetota bacterium]
MRIDNSCFRGQSLATGLVAVLSSTAVAAQIELLERNSNASLSVRASSNGAVRLVDDNDSTQQLLGAFGFSNSLEAEVTLSDTFSDGVARSTGTIGVSDEVSRAGGDSNLTITATRNSSITSELIFGSGEARSEAVHNQTVRFRLGDKDATYTLTGNFAPGPSGNVVFETNSLTLVRTNNSGNVFRFTEPTSLDLSGTLTAGLGYELRLRTRDQIQVPLAGDTTLTDSSTVVYTLSINEVPCPCDIADVNGDGMTSPADFNAWVIAFNNGAPECDQNGDGLCNPADFNAWVINFNTGC